MTETYRENKGGRSPEERLWYAVVERAMLDLTYDGKDRVEQLAQRQAQAWVEGNSYDFSDVCSFASIDHEAVRNAFYEGRIDRRFLKAAAPKEREDVA